MIQLTGYQIGENIYKSHNTLVYRGLRLQDKKPVIFKLLNDDFPTPEKIAHFRREYETLQFLKTVPGAHMSEIVQVYQWEQYQHSYIIVMEDIPGQSLDRWFCSQVKEITRQAVLPSTYLATVLSLAINMTKALMLIHKCQIIHKDINPSNIIYDPDTKQVKIIDFGISTLLNREINGFLNPEIMEGTLAYISPEQTGRINRAIDYRSDFYSLGVTLYELLTGQLPFATTDPLELVYNHIAIQPTPPCKIKMGIPVIVSDIILKLMAKDADDRYQSAPGLLYDLKECLNHYLVEHSIQSFTLAREDILDNFQISQRLYGREKETEYLISAFERTSQGSNEIVLVSGATGIGKTALVHEIYSPITKKRGFFISGKYDELQKNIPYSAIIQGFRFFVRQLLTESDLQIAYWRHKLEEALGCNGQVIVDVIPEVEIIMGPQPVLPELTVVEAQNRFDLTLKNFIRIFSQPKHPLVIFLDDLQWADGASLKLIEQIASSQDIICFLLIGTYRFNEVHAAHPLTLAIETISNINVPLLRLVLAPLTEDDIKHLLCDTLHTCSQKMDKLANMVQIKTNGNPYFVLEFLKTLHKLDLLKYDPVEKDWSFDLINIKNQSITENVAEMMLGESMELPEKTLEVIKLAACIGNTFDLKTLATAFGQPCCTTALILWEAMKTGLVLPINENYKLATIKFEPLMEAIETNIAKSVQYRFVHDRVQQAIYSFISEKDRETIHLRLGYQFLASTPPGEMDQHIFNIVKQLNLGTGSLANNTKRLELARLNLEAGRKAKTAAAYGPALTYLETGIDLLETDSWQGAYQLCKDLYIAAAEAAYLNTRFEWMEELANIVMDHAVDLKDKISVYGIRIEAYTLQFHLYESIQTGLDVLALLGMELPRQPGQQEVDQAFQKTFEALTGKTVESLEDLPEMSDEQTLTIMKVMESFTNAAYLINPNLLAIIAMEQIRLSLQYGNAPVSSTAYVLFGYLLCGILGDVETGYKFGLLALKIIDRFNAKEQKPLVSHVFASFIQHFKEPIDAVINRHLNTYLAGLDTGNLIWAANAAMMYTTHQFLAGRELFELEKESSHYSDVIRKLKHEVPLEFNQLYHQSMLNLLGKTEDPLLMNGPAFDERVLLPKYQKLNMRSGIYSLYFNKLFLSLVFYANDEALKNANLAEQYLDGVPGLIISPLFYFYDSLARLGVLSQANDSEKENALVKVACNQEKLKELSQLNATNYQHLYYLIEAERNKVEGNYRQAHEFYDRAIAQANQNKFIQHEAMALELAGRCHIKTGYSHLARYYLRDAYLTYNHWGALAKGQQLEKEFPDILTQANLSHETIHSTATTTATGQQLLLSLDLASVTKTFYAISGEIMLERLLVTLMSTLAENAGAQRGYLILNRDGGLFIEAKYESTIDISSTLETSPIDEAGDRLPLSMVLYTARTHENVILDSAASDQTFRNDFYIKSCQPKSVLCLPILSRGKLMGVLYLENNFTIAGFPAERVELLRILASQGAISIENARLYNDLEQKVNQRTAQLQEALNQVEHLATIDSLTGQYNRRKFSEMLNIEFNRVERFHRPLALIMFDVDHFKTINDTYGHPIGDEVLITLSNVVRKALRNVDTFARWGGDEFIILIPETDGEGALILAENVQRNIGELQIKSIGQITISVGVAEYQSGESIDQFITEVDQALYTAKRKGRNRVEIFDRNIE